MGEVTMQTPRSTASLVQGCYKNPYLSKWNILFDKVNCQWISFKPQEGHKVYPCYACRDMFGSKSSFIDHVNRRGMLITYRCPQCHIGQGTGYATFRFYNPCSFMLHVRKHFTAMAGSLDLDHVTIATLPIELAGFFPHPNVPLIYDVQEDEVPGNININTRFYSPVLAHMGQRVVHLTPNVLLFQYSASVDKGPVSLFLKAISSNIPRCQFVVLDYTNNYIIGNNSGNTVAQQPNSLQQNTHGQQATQDTVNNQQTNSSNGTATVELAPVSTANQLAIKEEPISTTEDEVDNQEPDEEEDEFLERAFEEPDQPILKQHLTYNTKQSKHPRCTECDLPVPGKMLEHLIGGNRPSDDRLKCVTCNYVAPTQCSLSAHRRIHLFLAPYVCPECGRQFPNDADLMDHLDGVCFHMAKQVRYRCNGRNCGKIFAQTVTFSSHFVTHMPSVFKCMVCSEFFFDEVDFTIHANSHAEYQSPGTFYKCLVCKETGVTYTAENFNEHINWHCTDPLHRVYVFICKYCRSYFRSTQTYAVHLLRCTKKSDDGVPLNNSHGVGMNSASPQLIRFSGSNGTTSGKSVQGGRSYPKPPEDTVTVLMEDSKSDIVRCIQCQERCTLDALVEHMQQCKARNSNNHSNGAAIRPTGRQVNGDANQRTHYRPSTGAEKKRKRPPAFASTFPSRVKKGPADNGLENANLQPTVFDGTYACKICDYRNTSRNIFQEHIVGHRHVSTAYQCMECGECFLVKPSLVKHLRYFHQIADTDSYLTENECCDQEAVTELVASINRVPADRDAVIPKEPLNENQCRVCRLQCDNEQELNKHFRVHGMAFIGNRNTSSTSGKTGAI